MLSSQFIFLPQLLSHCNKNMKWRIKALKQQASYTSVHLKQTDLLLDRHSQNVEASWSQRSHHNNPSWFPLYTSHLLLLVGPMQNRACTHDQSMKENANGHMLKANWQLNKLNKSGLCCICLPIIQSVILQHIHL